MDPTVRKSLWVGEEIAEEEIGAHGELAKVAKVAKVAKIYKTKQVMR